jgi:hypothetical protein
MRLITSPSRTIAILFASLILGAVAYATDVELLSPGQKVYKRGTFFGAMSPDTVVVERIDTENNRVLVSDGEGGVSEWVSADALYTGDELSSARVTDAIDGLAKASEIQRNAGIRDIFAGCMADYDFQQVLSQQAAESQHGISNETMCTCIATTIVDKESTETVSAITSDFAQVRLIGKERFLEYLNGCATPEPAPTSATAAVDIEAPPNEPVIDLAAIATPAASSEVTNFSDAATDASAAAAGAVDAAALAVAPAPAASAESPASPPQPPWFWAMVGAGGLLAVGGLFGLGVLVGRKRSAASKTASP